MRITFALPETNLMTGGLRVIAQYSMHLEAQGHEVVLAVRRPDRMLGRRQKLLKLMGLHKPYPPLPAERGYFATLRARVIHLDEDKPLRAEDLPDADAIISTWWTTAEWAEGLPKAKGRHIHFIQGYEDFTPVFSQRIQAVYNRPNGKIVVSDWLQKIIRERHGRDSVLVLNGVDTVQFRAAPRERNAVPRVGLLWAPHPRKNCPLALDAIVRLRAVRPDLQAIFFGGGDRPDNLPGWIAYEQRPTQDLIPEIYASCDLWLFPTISEGFGLPLLEAMACGTPVLATPAGAAPDLIEDGVNGRLLPADISAGAMATAADAFLAQGDEAWKAASLAAWRTAQQHDLAHAARSFEQAVERIIRN